MTAKVIDGKAVAEQVRGECRLKVEKLKQRGIVPGLAVIIVGDDPASRVYVRNKAKACGEVGMYSEVHELPGDSSQASVVELIERLNADPAIHGILVQLPLPKHLDSRRVLETIAVGKDVDGFHAANVGKLVLGEPLFLPCTPYGVMRLLEHENISVWGKNAVVVGASNIVGKPMAMLLLQKGATVTICNSKTQDLALHTILADILVVAVGRAHMVTAPMVKKGGVVIDVGMNRLADGNLAGDVDFEGARERAAYITPVPGGVGPMTVTMLVCNTIEAAERGCAA
ncbi:MAG: bifunctional methylenetetrahydrofolate dehydrogenase/methenyltetrahydrofolate cyclohydrolase FolD [Pseudomonadota bacterium]